MPAGDEWLYHLGKQACWAGVDGVFELALVFRRPTHSNPLGTRYQVCSLSAGHRTRPALHDSTAAAATADTRIGQWWFLHASEGAVDKSPVVS